MGAALLFIGATAQTGGFGDLPKTVNYHDARITNVGVVAADIYKWAVEDSLTHKVDTVYTAEPYFLWESDGDIEQQAQASISPAMVARL